MIFDTRKCGARVARPLALMVVGLTGACGDLSPEQGPGALWLHERDKVRCVNVPTACVCTDAKEQLLRRRTTAAPDLLPNARANARP